MFRYTMLPFSSGNGEVIQKEERKFKIGITSPLPEENGNIVYRNIPFRGPNPAKANETIRVRFIGQPVNLVIPTAFIRNNKGEYLLEHHYDPDLSLTFSSVPIRTNQFSFDGYSYSIAPYKPTLQSVQFSKLFLDINNSWSQAETTD